MCTYEVAMHRCERNGSTVLAVSVKSAIAGLVHHNFTGNSYRRKENRVACSNSIDFLCHGIIRNSLLNCSAILSREMSILEQLQGELSQIYKKHSILDSAFQPQRVTAVRQL